jgi:hypothetical protein
MADMFRSSVLLLTLGLTALPATAHDNAPVDPATIAWAQAAKKARATLHSSGVALPALPTPPDGVTDLKLDELFGPIGNRGLEYSAKARRLDGAHVRIVGFMVCQEQRQPGLFLLSSVPVITEESEYGACDELPSTTVHVIVPSLANAIVPLAAGPVVVTGKLELGPRAEADGRNSVARVILDPPASGAPLLSSAYAVTSAAKP